MTPTDRFRSLPNTMRFIFKYYSLKLTRNDFTNTTTTLADKLESMLVKTFIRNDVLTLSIPGQADYELEPTKPNEFKVKTMKGYLRQFDMNSDTPTSFIATTPNGTFKAMVKK